MTFIIFDPIQIRPHDGVNNELPKTALFWGVDVKLSVKYEAPFTFLKCINCNCNVKPEIGYWLDPQAVQQYLVQIRICLVIIPNMKLVLVHGASKCGLNFKQLFFS